MSNAFVTSHAPLRRPARTWTTSIGAIAGLLALGLPAPAAVAATLPSLSVSNMTVRETDAASTVANVRVVLSKTVSHRVSVRYETVNRTAKSPSDYRSKSGKIFFRAGDKAKTVAIPLTGDTRDEADETFRLRIFDPVHAKIADRSGTVTIRDNDPMPSMEIGNVEVTEPNAGSEKPMSFPVHLSTASGMPVTVGYTVSEDSADADDDYVAESSGTLYFSPGTTVKYVSTTAVGDDTDEVDETFTVTLSDAQNARLSDGSARGTIRDNDGPDISVENVRVREGHVAAFEVELSQTSKQDVTFDYDTDEGTAHAPDDYAAASGTKTIRAGDREVWVKVWTRDDHKDEVDETFYLKISDVTNAEVDHGRGVAKIDDDDGPRLWVERDSVLEGHDAHFKVKLSDRSPQDITFEYYTRDGSAKAPDDYRAVMGHKTIRSGDRDVWINVQTKDDPVHEGDEVFYLYITHVRDARLVDGRATGTIRDDDPAPPSTDPAVSIADLSVTREASPATLTVTLDKTSTKTVTVGWATNDLSPASAVAGQDYTPNSGTVTFDPGQTSQPVSIAIAKDGINEPAETFQVKLDAPSNATPGPQTVATVTILANSS